MPLVQFKFPAISEIIQIYLRLCFHFADKERLRDAQLIFELRENGSTEIGAIFKLDKTHLGPP